MAQMDSKQDIDVVSLEKETAGNTRIQEYQAKGLTLEDAVFLNGISEKEANKIFHKVDLRLVPMLGMFSTFKSDTILTYHSSSISGGTYRQSKYW